MKTIFLLLAVALVATTGCQSSNNGNTAGSNQTNVLPDQGRGPAAPVGGGTKNEF